MYLRVNLRRNHQSDRLWAKVVDLVSTFTHGCNHARPALEGLSDIRGAKGVYQFAMNPKTNRFRGLKTLA